MLLNGSHSAQDIRTRSTRRMMTILTVGSPSSGNDVDDDEITDLNLTFGDNQGSGVDTLKRFQPDVRDKNIAIAHDTFQQFTIKIPKDLEKFVDGYSFMDTFDPSHSDGFKTWTNIQAIKTCLQESSFSLFCSYTELMMTKGLQDVDALTKVQVSMLDIDTSSFTEDNESLKLSLQQADKDFFLFCKFKDTFKWRVPIDFSQYSNFLDKDNITVLLSNRTKNVAGFKDVDGATCKCLVRLANTVPMFTLDKIRHFMSSYHLQRIFVDLFELNQLNDPTNK